MNEIITNSPARLLLDGKTYTLKDFEEGIDETIKEFEETGDIEYLDNAILTMIALGQFTKFGIAKLLYKGQTWWNNTNQSEIRGDTFEDRINAIYGLPKESMKKYVSIWQHREAGDLPQEVIEMPLTMQQEVCTKLLDEGFIPTEDEWEDLIDAWDGGTSHLGKVIREIQGKPPTKASYVGYLERNGDIVFWHQDRAFNCGHILLPEFANDDLHRRVLEKVKARAIKGLGLKEK